MLPLSSLLCTWFVWFMPPSGEKMNFHCMTYMATPYHKVMKCTILVDPSLVIHTIYLVGCTLSRNIEDHLWNNSFSLFDFYGHAPAQEPPSLGSWNLHFSKHCNICIVYGIVITTSWFLFCFLFQILINAIYYLTIWSASVPMSNIIITKRTVSVRYR